MTTKSTTENTKTAKKIKTSPANMAQALISFRSLIETVKKKEDNPFYKSKYADLPSILDACKTPLKESGLALSHHMKAEGEDLVMVSVLTHAESGDAMESIFPVFGKKPQEIGSSMTYARRYNIQALLDIPTDEDDDGNRANNAPKAKAPVKKVVPPTENQIQTIRTLAEKAGHDEGVITKVLNTIKSTEEAQQKIEFLMNN